MTTPKQRTIKQSFVHVADRAAGLNERSMGDEREAQVILRAYTFALVVGTFALSVTGAVLALFGYWGFALGAIIFGGIQSYLAIGYAAANDVSLFALNKQTSVRRKRSSVITYIAILIVLLGARGYQMLVGRPVLGSANVDRDAAVSAGDFWSTVAGVVVGMAAVFVAKAVLDRRNRLKERDLVELEFE